MGACKWLKGDDIFSSHEKPKNNGRVYGRHQLTMIGAKKFSKGCGKARIKCLSASKKKKDFDIVCF